MELIIWDTTSTLTLPTGYQCPPEETMTRWPYSRNGKAVLEMTDGVTEAVDSLTRLVELYGIDDALSDADKLVEIKTARARAQDPEHDEIEEILADLESEDD